MARFTLPRDLYHGKDALSSLKNLSGKKAVVVVGGGSMKRFGFLDKFFFIRLDKRIYAFDCFYAVVARFDDPV